MQPSSDQLLRKLLHELRTPLSALKTAAHLLGATPDDATQVRELAALMARQIDELRRLIDKLEDAARSATSGDKLGQDHAAPANPTPAEPAAAASSSAGPVSEAAPLPRRRVLIVDDHAAAARLVGRLLETLGQTVRVVDSAEAALQELPAFQPQVVISDLAMPGLSGCDLAKKIREPTTTCRPRLVALTGYQQEEDRQQAIAAGFDDYLRKPIGLLELQALLRSLP
jgi:CheY-like chemotaxis protein